MSKHDYHTRTVDGARGHAERNAEPDCDDDGDEDHETGGRPWCPRSLGARCDIDEYDDGWSCDRCGHSLAK